MGAKIKKIIIYVMVVIVLFVNETLVYATKEEYYNKSIAEKDKANFYNLTMDDGLTNNNITDIYQDSRGYIWIGTEDGLNQYNGNIIIQYNYESDNKNTISSPYITKIIETNKEYVKQHPELPKAGLTSHPTKKLGIVTCMDTRLVGMLEEALGFHRGEIIVIKTAGNSVTQPIDNIVQSLLVATYGMEIEDVLIIGHENCGMIDFSATTFMESMKAKGISEDAIRMIEPGLIDWMDRFHISEDNVIYTVNFLRHHPLFPKGMGFYGGMMDPDTGEFRYIEI